MKGMAGLGNIYFEAEDIKDHPSYIHTELAGNEDDILIYGDCS